MVVPTVLLFQSRRAVRGPGALYACAVMVVFGFIANRLNVGITGSGSGQRHALHSEVERGGDHAVDRGRGLRDLPFHRAILPGLRGGRARAAQR